jgi:hypothetical protein
MKKIKGFNSCFDMILVTAKTHREEKSPNLSLPWSHQKENTFSRPISKATLDGSPVNIAVA